MEYEKNKKFLVEKEKPQRHDALRLFLSFFEFFEFFVV